MTSEANQPENLKARKAAPTAADTLVAHLTTRASNSTKFVEQFTNRPPKELSEDDLEAAKQAVRSDPALFARVAELAKSAYQLPPLAVRAKLLCWAGETVEGGRLGLDGWKPSSSDKSGSLIAPLAHGSGSTADAKEKQTADALLQVGVVVLLGQYGWTPTAILSELKTGFDKARKDAAVSKVPPQPDKLVGKLLSRASARQLQDYASIALLYHAEVVGAREQAHRAEQARQELYDRYLEAKAHGDRLSTEVAEKNSEIAELEARVAELAAELASVSSGAAHGQTNLRSKYRSFLDRQLSPKVREAIDALDDPEPFLDVAIHRLKSMKTEIDKEVVWLDGSSE